MKPLRGVGLVDAVGDDRHHDLVGHQLAARHDVLGACRPIGVPAATAARSMSPVESCTMPYFATSRLACVPLPAPGGPSRINPHLLRPRSFDRLIRPSYWCASR